MFHVHKTPSNTLLTLHLSTDFIVPPFIQEESSSVIESILLQAQHSYDLQKSLKFKNDEDSLKSFYDKKLLDATIDSQKSFSSELQRWQSEKSQLSQEISRLQNDLQDKVHAISSISESHKQLLSTKHLEATLEAQKSYSSDLERWQRERSQLSLEISRLQSELQTKLQSSTETLQSQNQDLSGKLLAANSQIQQLHADKLSIESTTRSFVKETYESQIKTLTDAHARDTNNLKEFIESNRLEKENYRNELMTLKDSKSKTSTKLGQVGEQSFDDLCNIAGIPLTVTSNEGHSGDFHALIDNQPVLFEIKNYSHTVPTKEVVKFKRDMEQHKDCVAGVFISMNTPIALTKSFEINWLPDRRPVIYISEFNLYDGIYLLEVVKNIINMNKYYSNDSNSDASFIIEKSFASTQSSLTKLLDILKNIKYMRKHFNDMLDTHVRSLESLKDDIDYSLTIISGKSSEDIDVPDSLVDIAPSVKSKAKTKTKPLGK